MIKSTKQHEEYWKERKINWKESYFDTFDHPHRALIIKELKKMKFGSLLEVGCASGPNLYRIGREFPYMQTQVGGIDISKDAVETAKKLLPMLAVCEVSGADELFLSDKSADVVLTDMCLIYLGKSKFIKTIREIKRVARKYVIFVEFHSNSWLKRMKLKLSSGYNAYDYEKILEKEDFWDIEKKKIKEEDWPGGNPQKDYGYIITAKL